MRSTAKLPPVNKACHGYALAHYKMTNPDTNIVNYWYEEGSGHSMAIRRTKDNHIEGIDVVTQAWVLLPNLFWGSNPLWIARAFEPKRKIKKALYERPHRKVKSLK